MKSSDKEDEETANHLESAARQIIIALKPAKIQKDEPVAAAGSKHEKVEKSAKAEIGSATQKAELKKETDRKSVLRISRKRVYICDVCGERSDSSSLQAISHHI